MLCCARSAGDKLPGIEVRGRRSVKRNFAAFEDTRRFFVILDFIGDWIPTGVVDLAGDSCEELLEGDAGPIVMVESWRSSVSFFIDVKPADVFDDCPEILDGLLPILKESEISEVCGVPRDAFR